MMAAKCQQLISKRQKKILNYPNLHKGLKKKNSTLKQKIPMNMWGELLSKYVQNKSSKHFKKGVIYPN